ncbi:uncharacterized protein LOC106873804 [Octopus bimaculoides]|uniref:uncharacterized protein LOC106873804 n=1 Tax=Octopus bimaculoides TaxID=37653 RepID=UPI00071D9214|nr:uncharacterized protein LOC106873804 [Octopus bimaculoides]|eukprot:XP_014776804.1 PREDICTED: uncharacterized protein LOC106873804 [Octopus bimaculoides]
MPRVRIQIEAEFENISTMQIGNVLVENKFRPGLRIISGPNLIPMVNNYQFVWNFSDVQNISMDYTATPDREATDIFFTNFIITEYSANLSNKINTEISLQYCLEMQKHIDRNWLHEFTALIFFLGIFLGLTLLIFIMLLIVIHRQRSITPYSKDYTKHKSLMMTASKWEDKQMDIG